MTSPALRFGVLGPVEAWHDDIPLDLGPPKRRIVLARLLLNSGQPVSVERLLRDLWPADVRRPGVVSTVHSHISRLRMVLDPERAAGRPSTLLVRDSSGYTLRASHEALDSTVFENLLSEAGQQLRGGRSEQAHQTIEGALKLWRGAAFADAADQVFAASEVNRLHSLRQTAEELRVTALLEMGRGDFAVPLAETLTITAPLREASWALLMKALYATDRGAEALQQYERFRGTLAEELGVDPGPALRKLHQAVLNEDTLAILPARRPPADVTATTTPATVAAPPGRTRELHRVCSVAARAAQGDGTQWVVVSGQRGAGRTWLLEEAARALEQQGFTRIRMRCCGRADTSRSTAVFGPTARLLNQFGDGQSGAGLTYESEEAALTAVLKPLATRRTVLVADDADAFCDACLELLRYLSVLLRDEPVVVICSAAERGNTRIASLMSAIARERVLRVALPPLSLDDVTALMDASGEAPDHADALHRRSEGNMLVLTALLELPRPKRLEPEAVPPVLSAVAAARLEAVGPQAATMIRQAAVCGTDLDAALLVELLDITREELLRLVDAAVQVDLVVWQQPDSPDGRLDGDVGRYRFHSVMREAILSTLSHAAQQLVHASAADRLRAWGGRHHAAAARHLLQAGPLASAEELARECLCAGRYFEEQGQAGSARSWYEYAAGHAGAAGSTLRQETADPVCRAHEAASGTPSHR
ncbi:BTAD domain-containing putative transcriptional regulator [Streptomyces sp. NPDC005065]|uniref:BTAD domain-containing putative transcriptional regulator n=1 Tax=unclassified Streptomyces TaxID=2593676 RepID=UPI0033BD2FED